MHVCLDVKHDHHVVQCQSAAGFRRYLGGMCSVLGEGLVLVFQHLGNARDSASTHRQSQQQLHTGALCALCPTTPKLRLKWTAHRRFWCTLPSHCWERNHSLLNSRASSHNHVSHYKVVPDAASTSTPAALLVLQCVCKRSACITSCCTTSVRRKRKPNQIHVKCA